MPLVATLLAVLGLAAAHVFAGRLRFLEGVPRSVWLSFAGGVAVAYVFLHILPELGAGQPALAREARGIFPFLKHHVYLLALLGLALFYALERAALSSRRRRRVQDGEGSTGAGIFWVHIGAFAVYNVLIGYLLLHPEEHGLSNLWLSFVAFALHFVVNDHGLREHHKSDYDRTGRWVLAAAVVLGGGIGRVAPVSDAVFTLLFAFLSGSIILNVLKEELPEERESRYWAFALGAGAYAALLLAV